MSEFAEFGSQREETTTTRPARERTAQAEKRDASDVTNLLRDGSSSFILVMPDNDKPSKRPQRTAASSLAERELASLREAARSKEAAEWDAKSREAGKTSDDWRRRWSLSLALGNSAGLLGIATILLDKDKRPVGWEHLLVPSAWCFMLGLVAAGSIPLLKSLAHSREKDWAWVVAREREDGGPTSIYIGGEEPEWSEDWRHR